MQIVPIASLKAVTPNGGTSAAIDTTGANCVAVFMGYGGSPTLSDNKGNTYSVVLDAANARWYVCLNAVTGPGHTWTVGGGNTASSIVVRAFSGVLTASAVVTFGTTSITTDPWTFRVNATPPEDECVVLFGAQLPTSTVMSISASGGWTVVQWQSGVASTNYGTAVVEQIQTAARTVGAAESLATIAPNVGGNTLGIALRSAPAGGGLTIATPSAFEIHQRSGSTGSIQITGSVTGSTEDIEASFNGGAYVTIATAVAPGAFSGTLSGQAHGMGTLTVRKKVTIAESATVLNVGIGDVFAVGGDSISDGRGTNAQVYTHGTLKAARFVSGAWSELIDAGPGAGSHWPILATRIMADQGVPVAFIRTGVGSTDVAGGNNQWAKPNSAYSGMTTAVTNSTAASVRGVLMHLGPNAVVNASLLTRATYNAAIDTLASNLGTDIAGAPKLHVGIFGEVSTGSPPDRVSALNNVRGAILEAHADNANVLPGPVLIDLDYTDGVHPLSDAQLQAVANRWWIALKQSLYGGSGGRGPRLSSATWNAGRDQLTVVFDRALKTGLSHATQCWAISDNGTPMTIGGVAYGAGANDLVITAGAAAAGPGGTSTLTFAGGDTAVGRVVPMSVDIALPGSAGVTQIPAEPIYAAAVSEVGFTFSVTPAGIPSTAVVGTPTVTRRQEFALAPAGIPSQATVGTPTFNFNFGTTFSISPTGIPSTAVVGTPTFNFQFTQLPVPPGTPAHRRVVVSQDNRLDLKAPIGMGPGDELDFEMDWLGPLPGPWLAAGEQLAAATVAPPQQITLLGKETTGSVVRLFLRLATDAPAKAQFEVLVGVVTNSTPPRRATRRLLIEVSRR